MTDQPAFPTYDDAEFGSGSHSLTLIDRGMSLRSYFAGQALAGMLAVPGNIVEMDCLERVRYALANADALLAELAKPKPADLDADKPAG